MSVNLVDEVEALRPPGPVVNAARSSAPAVAREVLVFAGCAFGLAAVALFALFPDPVALLIENGGVAPVAVVAAAFANATAVGGGFLFVPFFLLVLGLGAQQSLQLSLATQAFGMTSGAFGWSREWILGRSLALAAVFGGAGMAIGTFVVPAEPGQIKAVFGWVSIAIALAFVVEMRFGAGQHRIAVEDRSPAKVVVAALAYLGGGLVTAWVSIGIGEVVALVLLFVYGVRIDRAIATGVAALAVCSILGLAFHAARGGIPWELLVFTAPAVAVGGRFGARFGRWIESRGVRGPHRPLGKASPLKWIFVAILLVDGVAMLLAPAFTR